MEYTAQQKKKSCRAGRLLFTGLIWLCFPYTWAQTSHTGFLKPLVVQDLEYLRLAIVKTHPNPFAYTTQTEFNRIVDEEIDHLTDTVSYYTFRNAIRRIVHSIHCVHSTVLSRHISRREALRSEDRFLPLQVHWMDDNRFIVTRNYTGDSSVQNGSEILAINGHLMQEVMDTLSRYRSGDGKGDYFMRGFLNLPFQFNLLFDLHYPEDSAYVVVFKDTSGLEHSQTLPAIYEPQDLHQSVDTLPYHYVNRFKNVKLRFMQDSIAYLRVLDFDGNQFKAYRDCFGLIRRRGSNHLIIDLRYNYGGSMQNANKLLSYLIDSTFSFSLSTPVRYGSFDYYDANGMLMRLGGIIYFSNADPGTFELEQHVWGWRSYYEPETKNHYDGRIYILVNEHTLSAASYAASQLKHKGGAVLVGEPTGGGEFGNGGYTYVTFTLPNSRSRIKVPHNWVDYDIPHTNHQSLSPQIVVQPTVDDVLQQKDVTLQKTLDLIQQR